MAVDTLRRAGHPTLASQLWSSSSLQVGGLTLLALLLRLYLIGDKGLWYDEAATALMARASFGEIIQFHWHAAFEHPPLWVLFMRVWTEIFGQSEAALRLPAALASALTVPLLWQILALAWPRERLTRLVAVGLVAVSPLLTLYGQEARMYSLVTLLALASVYGGMRAAVRGKWWDAAGFVLANWLMLGFHYYALLLVAVETLVLVLVAARQRHAARMTLAVALSLLPFVLWAWFAPGFQTTVAVVLQQAADTGPRLGAFLDRLWRDLTFGAVRWQPRQAAVGYVVLPLFLAGLVSALRAKRAPTTSWGIFFALIVLLPGLVSLAFSGSLPTRYILFISPFVYVIVALGLRALFRFNAPAGLIGLLGVGLVAYLGLIYYFGVYHKSEYREMTAELQRQIGPADVVLLEAPRQYLLAEYYLPDGLAIVPIPAVDLPGSWPVTAPPVAPEIVDDQLQALIRQHTDLWLVLAGEDEVDPGEFVPRYLTAIAFQRECRAWLDVRLCRFTAPGSSASQVSIPLTAVHQTLALRRADISLAARNAQPAGDLLLVLHWAALSRPAADYTVTVRLADRTGQVYAQKDSLPIGPLLPPTAWSPGDEKPGYLALPLPDMLAPGVYDLVLGLYDPTAPALLPLADDAGAVTTLLKVADVIVGQEGTITLRRPGEAVAP